MDRNNVEETGFSDQQNHFVDQDEQDFPKGPPQACLFVASLSEETSEEMLREFFSEHGNLLNIKLLRDRSARPYAFVQYSSLEEAENALEQTKGKTLNNRRLRVEKARVNRTLFLAKLPKQLTSQDLRIMVEEYGPVESVTIIKNHQTNQSKGCGFVKFIYREDAIEAFVGLKTRQRKWVVEWATSTNDPDLLGVDKLNIFVGGLNPYLIGKEVLEEKFMQYGEIESLTLINKFIDQPVNEDDENSHQRSAFAFIRYRDESHSATAIEKENGAEWLDRRIRVQYCESQEMKNKRRANKFMQFQYSSPYYSGVQVPLPMMYMGGMPVSYIPPNYAKAYPDHPQAPAYGSFNFPMYYNNAPWLYAPQPPLYPEMIPPDGSYSPPMDVNNALTHLSMVELTLTN